MKTVQKKMWASSNVVIQLKQIQQKQIQIQQKQHSLLCKGVMTAWRQVWKSVSVIIAVCWFLFSQTFLLLYK